MVDLWVAEEDGSEGPAHGYNSLCSADHNRTSGLGCASGRLGTQTDHGYEDALFAGRVQDIIQRYNQTEYVAIETELVAAAAPLFLFWAPHNVHTSLMVPDEYLSKFDFMQPTDKQGPVWSHDPINFTKTPREGHTRQLYSAMVNYADTKMGEVVDLLMLKQMYNDTLIVFTTDNGGAIYGNGSAGGSNWPLRGGKGVLFQGGIRGVSWASGGWLPKPVRGNRYDGIVAVWE